MVACMAETDECPTACRESTPADDTPSVVKAGSLELTARPEDGRKVISDGVTSYLDTLSIKVSEDVTVSSITLERYGYSTTDDVDKIWLEDSEGNIISSEKPLSPSKDSVTLSLKKDYRTFSDKDTITIAVRTTALSGGLLTGTTKAPWTNIGFKVTNVECSAKDVNLDNYSAYLYDIISYAGSEITVKLMGKEGKSYNVAAGEYYEVAKLKVTATNSAIDVNGFTLTNASGLDLSDNVEDVKVKIDGEDVKSTYSIKKDTLKVNFADTNIAIKKSSLFTVSISLQDEFEDYNDAVAFYLANSADLRATETKNGTTVKFSSASDVEDESDAYMYKFVGGKVTFTNVKLASTIDAAAGSDGVVVAQWNVKLGGEPINIKSLTVTAEGSGAALVEAIKVFVDDEEFEANKNGQIKDVLIEKDATIKVVVDLDDDPDSAHSGEPITIKVNNAQTLNATTLGATENSNSNLEYNNSGEPVSSKNIAWSISISSIKLNVSSASLKLSSWLKDAEFVKGQTTTKTIFDGTYTAKKGDVDLNEVALIYGWTRPFAATDSVSIDVVINGKNVATLDRTDIASGTLSDSDYLDFSDVHVKAGESVSVKLVANIYADNTISDANEFDAQKLTLVLRGDDENGVEAWIAKATTVKLKITTSESIKVTDNSAKKTVAQKDSDVVLAQFTVKPSNTSDDVELTNLVLTFANFSELTGDKFEVTVDDDPVLFDDADFSGNSLVLDDISYTVPTEGVVVEVRYVDELAASTSNTTPYTVTVSEVNSTKPNTEFTRYVVPVLIKLSQTSASDGSRTKFTMDFDADDHTLTWFVLTYEGPKTLTKDEISDGDYVEALGTSDWAKFVTGVSYYVDGVQYEISKTDYSDYFKDNGNYLKVVKAS